MKQLKKRTLALVLASAVTVVGAFGAENYKNSLMSLKFENSASGAVNVTLLTKQKFENSVNVIKKDAYTHVIMLPDTNSEIPNKIELGKDISSVDIKTMPYTNSGKGYTKITIKTFNNIPLYAKTALFLNDNLSKPQEIPTKEEQIVTETKTVDVQTMDNTSVKNTSLKNSQNFTNNENIEPKTTNNNEVDINDSIKQFQPSTTEPVEKKALTEKKIDFNETSPKAKHQEAFYIILGAAFVLFTSIFLMLKAKEKITELTGEQSNYDVNDEPKNTTKTKKKKTKINSTINHLNKKYAKPYKITTDEYNKVEPEEKNENNESTEKENVVLDLDELLQEKNNSINTLVEDTNTQNSIEIDNNEDENIALEEFLKAYGFEDDNQNEIENNDENESFDEQLYEECINNHNLKFSKDDIEKIETLINSEISDETIKNAPKILQSSKKDKKPSPLEILENFVTTYTIQQNITFTNDDINALKKLINVEIDTDFVTDLRTNPNRMKQMQDEIARQKSNPHKTSELLTLNVKDMLPDLSLALKQQGGRRIESEVKPQVVYFSEGYDVQKLKLNDALPDLSKEINNKDAYKTRPSDAIEYVDTSYDVQKMSITDEMPDLQDLIKNPEKYNTPEPKPKEVDEEALLRNISNVTFKPFDDGTRDFEILNEISDEKAPTVSDLQEEFNQLGDNFEIVNQEEESSSVSTEENDDFESLYNQKYVDLDKKQINVSPNKSVIDNILANKTEDADKLIETINNIKKRKQEKKNLNKNVISSKSVKENKSNPIYPDFCIIDGEKFSIKNTTNFTDKMGCYLAHSDKGYCILGFAGEKVFKIKYYEKLNTEKLQSRITDKLEDGTVQYIIRIGIHKFIMNVKQDDMEFVMDLC